MSGEKDPREDAALSIFTDSKGADTTEGVNGESGQTDPREQKVKDGGESDK
ncbi:MAG: hypothetical protein ACJ73N_12815 [Bryobacteraceae bacterium]